MDDTIFALSSGQPPAGVAVIRLSGAQAGAALAALAGGLPVPRRASLRRLRDVDGSILDQALVLWLPGPGSVTGEDMAELHLHGGRAVVAVVSGALQNMPGLRPAKAGEFTHRAFARGRIDLAEAEGLADLLAAETELQRRSALSMAGGALSEQAAEWRDRALALSAMIEAALDFSDEGDVGDVPPAFHAMAASLADELKLWLARPRAEILREGYRVAIAGPPNAGKSTLFNALVESEAAIISPIAGTTRDALQRSVAMEGIAFCFVDTAGLRDTTSDPIEAIGIDRARGELQAADLVLWLGPQADLPEGAWDIEAQCDRPGQSTKRDAHHRLSALTGEGMEKLRHALVAMARQAMPKPGEAALNARQRGLVTEAAHALSAAAGEHDPLIAAEYLRATLSAFDRLTGRAATEDMLDTLFGRFCIGK